MQELTRLILAPYSKNLGIRILFFTPILIAFGMAIRSTYLCFACTSLFMFIYSYAIVNGPYIRGLESCEGYSEIEIINCKIKLSTWLFLLGIVVSLPFYALVSSGLISDPDIYFVFYGYEHLIGIILLTTFPFLVLTYLFMYITYRLGEGFDIQKIIYIVILSGVMLTLIPAFFSYYGPIILNEDLALISGISVAIVSSIVSIIIYRRLITERKDLMEARI